ncbi:MAG: tRNA (adenosine(37)-N6)-threonylcarbamoyltransferase complex dimerization subunit type 1 TsaB [Holophagaceae bacterium]|nr:tRNA (adenosine(37)-N6)-threonylcarbamoyltransferase complex dimerization subunit type 1 TsaB [Holophagaceae bacterium]
MLLGLDTTTEFLHLVLVDGDRAHARRVEVGVGNSHSLALMPSLDGLFAAAGARPADLSGVACCVGPGGFTSLRIGVATAEGLALAGLPTWGFSAFELRARALLEAGQGGAVWIVLDGQRGEAFLQPWAAGQATAEAGKATLGDLPGRLGDADWWAPAGFAARAAAAMPRPMLALGDEGAATLKGLEALTRACAGREAERPLRPFYLRATDAEVNFPEAAKHLHAGLRTGLHR